jgi:hypothetical protein
MKLGVGPTRPQENRSENLLTGLVVDITEKVFMLPGNTWHRNRKLKLIGRYMYHDVSDGV